MPKQLNLHLNDDTMYFTFEYIEILDWHKSVCTCESVNQR